MAHKGFGFVALLLTLIAMPILPAWAAELVVIESTAPGLAAGQIIKDGALLEIPSGAIVTLIAESGETIVLSGPHNGAAVPGAGVSDNNEKQANGDLLSSLSSLLMASGNDTTAIGLTRATPTTPPTDPWMVDTGRSGHQCVPENSAPKLWRGKAARTLTVVIRQAGGDLKTANVRWIAGEHTAQWPDDFPLSNGAAYFLRAEGGNTARKVFLHRVPGGMATDAHKAAWMVDAGCVRQALNLIKPLR